ncbi:MAG: c-type cytochrome [Halopseudomonas sp.]
MKRISLLLALCLGSISLASAEDLVQGKALYLERCSTCHGNYGEISTDVVPNLLGQYPGYMLTQLHGFLSEDPKTRRGGPAGNFKRSILMGLDADNLHDIVGYLDSIEYRVEGATQADAKARGELAMAGWWLANYAGCGNCHGDNQMGVNVRSPLTGEIDPTVQVPLTPKLVALKGGYIDRQLAAYMSGQRAGGMAGMKHIMAPLFRTPRLIQAVGAYAEGVSVIPVNTEAAQ